MKGSQPLSYAFLTYFLGIPASNKSIDHPHLNADSPSLACPQLIVEKPLLPIALTISPILHTKAQFPTFSFADLTSSMPTHMHANTHTPSRPPQY